MMTKLGGVFLFILLITTAQSCDESYEVGNTGQAGGIIFYDSGEYGIKGWRYLEVAPSGWSGEKKDPFKIWGFKHRMPSQAVELTVDSGKDNTMKYVNNISLEGTAADVASKYSNDYNGATYKDWFLPSREELILIYTNLHQQNLGNFNRYDTYWSSSEDGVTTAWAVNFNDGFFNIFHKGGIVAVRPVKAFYLVTKP